MPRTAQSPISFILREPKSKKPTPIVGIFRFNNTHLKFATNFKVLPAHWNPAKARIRNVIDAPSREDINNFLDSIESAAEKVLTGIKSGLIPTEREAIRERLDSLVMPVEKKEEKITLFRFITDFISKAPTRINPDTGKHISGRTIQKYETVSKVLKDFASTYRRPVDFETIDLQFYEDFTAYLTIKKEFATNNVGKYLQTLKVFLNEASAKGMQVKQDYRNKRFKVLKEDADNIYLNETELTRLLRLDLSDNKRLERVRDLFLVGCYTGLRFSDLTNIRPENVKDGMIAIEQQKTGKRVVIPFHPVVSDMLARYNGNLPQSISNQKFNDYIKEVCKQAELNSLETKTQTKGGQRLTKTFQKWELVSTHSARRSFATNMYLLGVPPITIMRITGHRTEKAFLTYIRLDDEQHAKVMRLHLEKPKESPKPVRRRIAKKHTV